MICQDCKKKVKSVVKYGTGRERCWPCNETWLKEERERQERMMR